MLFSLPKQKMCDLLPPRHVHDSQSSPSLRRCRWRLGCHMRLSIASLPTLARCAKPRAYCGTVVRRQQTTHTSDSRKGFLKHLTVNRSQPRSLRCLEQASSRLEFPAIASSKHRDALLSLQVALKLAPSVPPGLRKRNSNRFMNIALKNLVGRRFSICSPSALYVANVRPTASSNLRTFYVGFRVGPNRLNIKPFEL